MAENKMKTALETQRSSISSKLEELGFNVSDGLSFSMSVSSMFGIPASGGSKVYDAVDPGTDYGSKINDPDTWSGPLADTQAECIRADVNALVKAFTDLLDALDYAYLREPDQVDDSDPRATWMESGQDAGGDGGEG